MSQMESERIDINRVLDLIRDYPVGGARWSVAYCELRRRIQPLLSTERERKYWKIGDLKTRWFCDYEDARAVVGVVQRGLFSDVDLTWFIGDFVMQYTGEDGAELPTWITAMLHKPTEREQRARENVKSYLESLAR